MSADWWQNFGNNLATDLAPLIALFGEVPTKQFLSETLTFLDILIFSIAPLGILTAIVSAIRVGGNSSLRAFIGRAQEGGGIAEAELCSSTSRDVCELYNNGGVARVFGRPKILEVVHSPRATDHDNYDLKAIIPSNSGIYLFKEYITTPKGDMTWNWTKTSKRELRSFLGRCLCQPSDTESNKKPMKRPRFSDHPNLSLNVGIKKISYCYFFLAATTGVLLQSAVLVFAALATYRFPDTFRKDDSQIAVPAFPFMFVGTILLSVGMGLCAHVVERSTQENILERKTSKDAEKSRLFWIQPGNQIIGDQTFESFAYCDTAEKPIKEYTTSWKKNQNGRDMTAELLVWLAIACSVPGFALQFLGLRTLHSTIAVAQFVVMIIMSIIRAGLRTQRLSAEKNLIRSSAALFEGHELDWLALRLQQSDAHGEERETSAFGENCPESVIWRINTFVNARKSYPILNDPETTGSETRQIQCNRGGDQLPWIRGFSEIKGYTSQSDLWKSWLAEAQRDESVKRPTNCASVYLKRCRLARLTGARSFIHTQTTNTLWDEAVIRARRPARILAQVIEGTMDSLYRAGEVLHEWENAHTILLALGSTSTISPVRQDDIFITIKRDVGTGGLAEGFWKVDHAELEAILGLWLWSIKLDMNSQEFPKNDEINDDEEDYYDRSNWTDSMANKEIPSSRIVSFGNDIRIDPKDSILTPWLGDRDMHIRKRQISFQPMDHFDPSSIWYLKHEKVEVDPEELLDHFVLRNQASEAGQGISSSRPVSKSFQTSKNSISTSPEPRRFFGWHLLKNPPIPKHKGMYPGFDSTTEYTILEVPSESPLDLMCAQEIFCLFLVAILRLTKEIGENTDILRGRRRLHISSNVISDIIETFREAGLGSEQDALACVIPTFVAQDKANQFAAVQRAISEAEKHREARSWKKAEELLRAALELSSKHDRQRVPNSFYSHPPDKPTALCTVCLCELYRRALSENEDLLIFALAGIHWMIWWGRTAILPAAIFAYAESFLLAAGTRGSLKVASQAWVLVDSVGDNNTAEDQVRINQDQDTKRSEFRSWMDSNAIDLETYARENLSMTNYNRRRNLLQPKFGVRDLWEQCLSSSPDASITIFQAIEAYDLSRTLFLLDVGIVNQENNDGVPILSLTAQKGWYPVVKGLIELGARVCIEPDHHSRNTLSYAIESKDEYTVVYIVEHGGHTHGRSNNGKTPLLEAACSRQGGIVKLLLRKIKNYNDMKDTIHCAIQEQDSETFRYLIHEMDFRNRQTPTSAVLFKALRCAIKKEQSEIEKMLLEIWEDPQKGGLLGTTALHEAIRFKKCKVVKPILLHINNTNGCKDPIDRMGNTPLFYAAKNGDLKHTTELLAFGANANIANSRRKTPLMAAAENRAFKTVRRLIDHKVEIEARDENGWTALTYACDEGCKKSCLALLRGGARTDSKDKDGRTPFSYAPERISKDHDISYHLQDRRRETKVLSDDYALDLLFRTEN